MCSDVDEGTIPKPLFIYDWINIQFDKFGEACGIEFSDFFLTKPTTLITFIN